MGKTIVKCHPPTEASTLGDVEFEVSSGSVLDSDIGSRAKTMLEEICTTIKTDMKIFVHFGNCVLLTPMTTGSFIFIFNSFPCETKPPEGGKTGCKSVITSIVKFVDNSIP
jgi:hypothetical protein